MERRHDARPRPRHESLLAHLAPFAVGRVGWLGGGGGGVAEVKHSSICGIMDAGKMFS